MSAIPNHLGGLLYQNGHTRRASTTTVTFKGVELEIEYVTEGEYMSATETDAAEYPLANILSAKVGGVDIWHLLGAYEQDLCELVEREWRS